MSHTISLTDQENDLILELLQSEIRILPMEIHHTTSHQLHADLKNRLKVVEELIERLRQPISVR